MNGSYSFKAAPARHDAEMLFNHKRWDNRLSRERLMEAAVSAFTAFNSFGD
jgi:hypothetical protein